MSKTPYDKDCIALDEPQVVDHVSDLSVGDRVRIGDRVQPLTVVDIGTRSIRDSRTDAKTLQTPVAKLRGDWQNAAEVIIGHQITRWRHGEDTIENVLRERETIVTMDSGTPVEPLRTHVALAESSRQANSDNSSKQPVVCDGGCLQRDGDADSNVEADVDAAVDEETDIHVPDDDAVIITDGGSSVQASAVDRAKADYDRQRPVVDTVVLATRVDRVEEVTPA